MSKIRWYLRAMFRLIRNPRLLNRVMDDDEGWEKYLAEKYGLPGGLRSVPFSTLVSNGITTIEPFAFLDGGSLPTDLALLRTLVAGFAECRYFEIGTWRGESVANVAAVAKECQTLNLSDEQLREMGKDEAYVAMHRYFSAGIPNVTHLSGDSQQFDFAACGKFDLVFVDGDHHYRSVKNDTEQVTRHLIHKNSIVVWHDAAHDPEHPRYEVLAGILDGLPAHMHMLLYHVANTKCAILLDKPVEATLLTYPQRPATTFRITLESITG